MKYVLNYKVPIDTFSSKVLKNCGMHGLTAGVLGNNRTKNSNHAKVTICYSKTHHSMLNELTVNSTYVMTVFLINNCI